MISNHCYQLPEYPYRDNLCEHKYVCILGIRKFLFFGNIYVFFCTVLVRAQRVLLRRSLKEKSSGSYVTLHVRRALQYCFIIQCLTYIIIMGDPTSKSCVSIDLHCICLFTLEGRKAGLEGATLPLSTVLKTLSSPDCSLCQRLYHITKSAFPFPHSKNLNWVHDCRARNYVS